MLLCRNGHQNADHYRYCGTCGLSLEPATPGPPGGLAGYGMANVPHYEPSPQATPPSGPSPQWQVPSGSQQPQYQPSSPMVNRESKGTTYPSNSQARGADSQRGRRFLLFVGCAVAIVAVFDVTVEARRTPAPTIRTTARYDGAEQSYLDDLHAEAGQPHGGQNAFSLDPLGDDQLVVEGHRACADLINRGGDDRGFPVEHAVDARAGWTTPYYGRFGYQPPAYPGAYDSIQAVWLVAYAKHNLCPGIDVVH